MSTTTIPAPRLEEFQVADLVEFKQEDDPDALLGDRWLGRGMAALIYGPAGAGKSSLRTHGAVTWAIGASWWGITPKIPLRSLIIQAENDRGDEAEMLLGAARQLEIDPMELAGRVTIVQATSSVGPIFISALDQLLEKYTPDIVWIDPLFSFAGDDLSLQKAASQFLREGLDPVIRKHRVIAFLLHHAGKPPRGKAERDALDHSSSYFGSVELAAYPRAVMSLRKLDDGGFVFSAAPKRGKRAKMRDLDGNAVEEVYLEHSDTGIGWIQVSGPMLDDEGKKQRNRLDEYVRARKRFAPESMELKDVSLERIKQEMDLSTRMVREYEARFKDQWKLFKSFQLR
jgi:hypothetical protein